MMGQKEPQLEVFCYYCRRKVLSHHRLLTLPNTTRLNRKCMCLCVTICVRVFFHQLCKTRSIASKPPLPHLDWCYFAPKWKTSMLSFSFHSHHHPCPSSPFAPIRSFKELFFLLHNSGNNNNTFLSFIFPVKGFPFSRTTGSVTLTHTPPDCKHCVLILTFWGRKLLAGAVEKLQEHFPP